MLRLDQSRYVVDVASEFLGCLQADEAVQEVGLALPAFEVLERRFEFGDERAADLLV